MRRTRAQVTHIEHINIRVETQRDLSPVGPLDRVEHAVGQGEGGGLAGLVVLDQAGQHAVGPTAHRLPSTQQQLFLNIQISKF